jgi:hypothetical protein
VSCRDALVCARDRGVTTNRSVLSVVTGDGAPLSGVRRGGMAWELGLRSQYDCLHNCYTTSFNTDARRRYNARLTVHHTGGGTDVHVRLESQRPTALHCHFLHF